MMKNISGIQQIGIGVPNVKEAFKWYRQQLGMDIPVFEEAAEANLMLPYTGGKPHQRHAILAINMKGGGGFEIWQYTSRTPQPSVHQPLLGDTGIFIAKVKTSDVKGSYRFLKQQQVTLLSNVQQTPDGREHFFISDPYGNIFELVESESWFGKGKQLTGGPCGAVIGVSNIDKSVDFYRRLLGYDETRYDVEEVFEDLKALPGGDKKVRRVLLTHRKPRTGSFSQLLGHSQIELVQVHDRQPKKIFNDRYWGDLGFIHLCFDVTGMDALKKECETMGHPFTVDSADSFDMGEAAGRFSYVEDPDGTLIEFVETHKIPVLKKIGWYLDLRKRNPQKSLPAWMLKAMALNRVND